MTPPKSSLTIAIAGSSSSGKTSSVALLSQLLPPSKTVFVIADAYSKDFEDLPVSASGFPDADSGYSIWYEKVKATVQHAQLHGRLPDSYPQPAFIADDLANATARLRPDFVEQMRQLLATAKLDWDRWGTIVVLDGVLLYHDEVLLSMIDVKLFLRTTEEQAKIRRRNRYGGSWTPEGGPEFWKVERYFDECVWPHYSAEHAWLFANGDVEDLETSEGAKASQIWIPTEPNLSLEDTLAWEMRTLLRALERQTGTE